MTSPLVVQFRKEVRALLPWWVGGLLVVTAAVMLSQRDPDGWLVITYMICAMAIATVAMGHEQANHTFAALLVQPVSRMRILAIKMATLVAAVVSLALIAGFFDFDDRVMPTSARTLMVWGPVAVAIGLTPLLTLVTGRPLAAAVFSIAIPGALVAILNILWASRLGPADLTATWNLTLGVSALGLIALWPAFGRHQVAGGGRQAASSARPIEWTGTDRRTTKRNWSWLLVKKEFRLQSMTFAVSGLYVLGCAAIALARRGNPAYVGPTFYAISSLHLVFISILAGAQSSAEERQVGTLSAQLLLPKPLWKQWTIKCLVTVGIAMALAIGVPHLIMAIHHPPDAFLMETEAALGVLALTTAAMYVSALSSSSLWALLATFPALGLGYALGGLVLDPLGRIGMGWSEPARAAAILGRSPNVLLIGTVQTASGILLATSLAVLALSYAARNYRVLDRSVRRVALQIVGLLLFAAVAIVVFYLIALFTWTSLR